ncbi:MAG: GNAT family N-acetyltransferase, partial [Desulfamplus sp.]|nr:GNAT family N-acetyltransferase [Desulfamplus sp.]
MKKVEPELIPLDVTNGLHVDYYIKFYQNAFQVWQREPENVVMERHRQGKYFSKLAFLNQQVIGFYTINPVPELGYTSLNFLAVDKSIQKQGIGSLLIEDVKQNFRSDYPSIDILIVEAEGAATYFYMSHGIYRLQIKYKPPTYNGDDALTDTDLLIYGDDIGDFFQMSILKPFIKHILTYGYALQEDDPRFNICLEWNKMVIPIIKK